MAEICCGVVSESESSPPCESSQSARQRRIELRRLKAVEAGCQRPITGPKLSPAEASIWPDSDKDTVMEKATKCPRYQEPPKYGASSICGRRRDMEDAVAIHPSFCHENSTTVSGTDELHYYGVYDGHGCSHVAMKCRDRLHELVKEELESKEEESNMIWTTAMTNSFIQMEKEVIALHDQAMDGSAICRCQLEIPQRDAVGSTAVVAILTSSKIIVANCGDSRAVLCRNGKPFPLSIDHKPDRPDELNRIESAGGRVIFWDGARVMGMLAMSRAIGDTYFKPYVICEPEVTITDRMNEDECLILASDGLWDVVSNNTACFVAGMCLNGKGASDNSDEACSEAASLLTKLALARSSEDNVSVVVINLRNTL